MRDLALRQTFQDIEKLCFVLKHDWVISGAMRANLATHEDAAAQRRPAHEAAITERASPKAIKLGFKD